MLSHFVTVDAENAAATAGFESPARREKRLVQLAQCGRPSKKQRSARARIGNAVDGALEQSQGE